VANSDLREFSRGDNLGDVLDRVDALVRLEKSRIGRSRLKPNRVAGTWVPATPYGAPTTVDVINGSGEDKKPFECVGISGSALTPIAEGDTFYGTVTLTGVTAALDDANHTLVYPKEGTLHTGYGGCGVILYKESGTGSKIGIVNLGASIQTRLAGTLSSALSTAIDSANIEDIEVLSGPSISAATVTAYNTHHWPAKAGARCRVEWSIENERFEFYQIDC
jgi:hypothetical protein